MSELTSSKISLSTTGLTGVDERMRILKYLLRVLLERGALGDFPSGDTTRMNKTAHDLDSSQTVRSEEQTCGCDGVLLRLAWVAANRH